MMQQHIASEDFGDFDHRLLGRDGIDNLISTDVGGNMVVSNAKDRLLNPTVFLICHYVGFALWAFVVCVGIAFDFDAEKIFGNWQIIGAHIDDIIAFAGVTLFGVGVILYHVMLFQIWRFVINRSLKASLKPSIKSPAQAVGFLFIPFYNIYWVFKVYGAFAKDFNALANTTRSSVSMSEDLGRSVAVTSVLMFVPFLGILAAAALLFFLLPIFIYKSVGVCSRACSSELGISSAPIQ